MIMTIDLGSYSSDDLKTSDESILFHRLYAPTAPHTTSKTGRSCTSCHNNPAALGYGRGVLNYTIDGNRGKWTFIPAYGNNPNDGLPEDAWIPFPLNFKNDNPIISSNKPNSTRTDFRPFTIEEQKKILRVGSCFTCHSEDSALMMTSLQQDFNQFILQISDQCILPDW
jgi:hypothetical protein